MKALLLIIAIGVCCMADNIWRDFNTEVQKRDLDMPMHYAIGAGATALTYSVLPEDMPEYQKTAISLAVPILLGILKESTDKNYDTTDILEYGTGGGLVLPLLDIDF